MPGVARRSRGGSAIGARSAVDAPEGKGYMEGSEMDTNEGHQE